jgi:catechol 2,3-dioxygenase-like lactoylglutathione lyase family enzyme
MKKNAAPEIFRILIPAKKLDQSRRFYEALLGISGREVAGGRIYFDCGSVILGVLDHSSAAKTGLPRPAEALYFSTSDLEGVHLRARALGALSSELIHNDPANPAGEIVVRPWGERSFYVDDPSGNPLCFVDSRTLFTGTPRQITALRRAEVRSPKRGSRPAAVRPTRRKARPH